MNSHKLKLYYIYNDFFDIKYPSMAKDLNDKIYIISSARRINDVLMINILEEVNIESLELLDERIYLRKIIKNDLYENIESVYVNHFLPIGGSFNG